jgi:hypothetical protein
MTSESVALCLTAASVGMLHTLAGPDHYIPFVAMSRAGGWSPAKTLGITVGCGLAHVAGSAALAMAAVAIGAAALPLEVIETLRGDAAAWLLIALGIVCLIQGLRGGRLPRQPHRDASAAGVWAPWWLFLVFAFGPCEPLFPLLVVPAARGGAVAVAGVLASFAVATVTTMAVAVVLLRHGFAMVAVPAAGSLGDAAAGLAVLACGVLVKCGL